jgi:hypothetical protein
MLLTGALNANSPDIVLVAIDYNQARWLPLYQHLILF